MIVPGSSSTPLLKATRVLPWAILLVAKSRTIGSLPGRGMPTQNGLVPMRASRPPNGATIGRDRTLTKWIDTSPAVDALLGPVADPAEVVRMRQADDADAVLLRPLDAERHRLGADHLAVALAAVERQQRRRCRRGSRRGRWRARPPSSTASM